MEKETTATSSRSSYGAGGKLRKPSSRKPPSTPYSRPTRPSAQQNGAGWLSKLVSPAYRIISARILPSFFTKSQENVELQQDAWADDVKDTPDLGTSRFTENAGPSRWEDNPISQSDPNEQSLDKGAANSEDGFSRIEQLVQGKRFSREEINRLTAILNSSAAGPSDVEPCKKNGVVVNNQEAAEVHVADEISRSLAEQRQEDFSKAMWGTSTPFRQTTIRDEVGASPVDIARAYMGGQTTELGLASRNITQKDERAMRQRHGFPSMTIMTSPSSKSSICWPGVVMQDNSGYLTPQDQRPKFGLHNFPRTPYSRTIYSKSKSRISYLHSDRDKNISSLQHSQTPSYQQMKTRSDSLDDGYRSIGPVRRSRYNIATESPYRGSVSLQKSVKQISHVENADASGRETPLFKMTEPGSTSRKRMSQSIESNPQGFDLGVGVHPQSSQIARKILDQIDRKVPTLQEKAAELRIANSFKKPVSSGVTMAMPMENVRLVLSNGDGFYKNSSANDQICSSQKNGDKGIPLSRVFYSAQSNFASENYTGSGFAGRDNGVPSLLFGKTSESQTTTANEKASDDHQQRNEYAIWTGYNKANGQDFSETVSGRSVTDALGLQKKQPQSHGNKPVLASLSVDRRKPNGGVMSGNNNSTGFTFPVATSSGVFSEPPTPSVMPSASATVSKQCAELADDVPSYTFGSKRFAPALVFSFPSTSDTSTQADTSEINFTFGSDTKNRISFSSVSNNSACY